MNLTRDAISEDLILFFQVADLAAKLAVRGTGDQGQQGVKAWSRQFAGVGSKWLNHRGIALGLYPADRMIAGTSAVKLQSWVTGCP